MSAARHLLVDSDGETILAVVRMSAEDAALNAPPGGYAVAIGDDTGARIHDGTMKLSGGVIVDIASGSPATGLEDVSLTALE